MNRKAKKFCKDKFATCYSVIVQKEVDGGVNFEDVNVDRRLSILKPIHATCLVTFSPAHRGGYIYLLFNLS